jgi:hypothetical protein
MEEERLFLIPRGMKKGNSPFPQTLRNRKSDSLYSSFLKEEYLMRLVLIKYFL